MWGRRCKPYAIMMCKACQAGSAVRSQHGDQGDSSGVLIRVTPKRASRRIWEQVPAGYGAKSGVAEVLGSRTRDRAARPARLTLQLPCCPHSSTSRLR